MLAGVTLAVGTLGLVCLADPPPALCDKARRVTTGADGGFAFDLRGRDTQGSFGTVSTFHLSAGVPAGAGEAAGPLVAARFEIQSSVVDLPALRLWRPRVTVAGGRVEWTPIDQAYGPLVGSTTAWSVGVPPRPVWSVEGPSPAAADPRVLEDTRGAVAVATLVDPGLRITTRSPSLLYTGPAGPPPSRRAACTVYAGETATPLPPCPLTDGDFAAPVGASPHPSSAVRTAVAVDLGRSLPVTLVVVRGCPAECGVETSADGRTWTEAGTGSGAHLTVSPRAGATARQVRVRSTRGLDVSRLAEISVW